MTTTQPELPPADSAYVRATDPITAKRAAKYPQSSARTRLLLAFYDHRSHGLTVYEAARYLGAEKGTTDRRRAELLERGQIINSNQERATNTGSGAIVWTITAKGIDDARALMNFYDHPKASRP